MSKGGTSVSTTEIDPQLKSAYLQNLEQARSVAAGLPVQQFAGFNPMYRAGEEAAYNIGLTPFTAQSIQEFQNPYEQQVIQGTLGDIEQARQMAALRDAQQATAAKAFGGSRDGVQSCTDKRGILTRGRTHRIRFALCWLWPSRAVGASGSRYQFGGFTKRHESWIDSPAVCTVAARCTA